MNIEAIRSYCLQKKGVSESFPFDKETLVFKVLGKIFLLAPLERVPSQVNLKYDPLRALDLRESHDGIVVPGYHMNKKHWNTLFVDQLPKELVKELIDHSYDLVVSGLPRKQREALKAL